MEKKKKSGARVPVRVSQDSEKTVREFAKVWGLEVGPAVDKLIKIAAGRSRALAKYAAKTAKPSTPAPKPKARAKAASKRGRKPKMADYFDGTGPLSLGQL
jgi:hypothetical protein